MRFKHCAVLTLAMVLLLALGAVAQEITGSLVGTVKDQSGAVVPNATVTITNTDKNIIIRTLTTGQAGEFSAPLLPIGHYSVSVQAGGFAKFTQSGIELNVNDRLTINPTLKPGAAVQEVTVQASAVEIQLQTPTAAGLVTGTQVRELSLNNRNYEQLVTLVPGVSSTASDQIYVGATNPLGTNTVNFSMNGARTSQNNWMVDGADNVDRGSNLTLLAFPSVDAIAEFKVLRAQYDAEFGRAGGGQVNVVTRSGGSTFHGGGYEFFRNNVLNANSFFNKRFASPTQYLKRPPLRYNNFGWTLGGPVYIPGKYNTAKNKTFFFFSQEFRRVITYTNPTAVVATAAERQGNFAHPVCVAFSGSTCTATATSIPQAQWSQSAQQYLKDIFSFFPLPNDPTDPHGLRSTYANTSNFREEMLKVDHVFGPRLTINGKILRDSIPTIEPAGLFTGSPIPGLSTTETNSPGHNYTIRATATLTPTLLLETGYGYSYGAIISRVTGRVASNLSPDIKIPLAFTPTLARIPAISFTSAGSATGVSGFGPYDDFNRNHSTFANISKVSGHHTIKAGFTYYHYQKTENAGGNNVGTFQFNNAGKPTGTLDFEQAWANFLLGRSSRFTQDALDMTPDIRDNQMELYAQDAWRIRPNLTLSYGLRYSLFRQPTDAKGMLTNFDPRAYDPAKAPCIVNTQPTTSGTPTAPKYGTLGIIDATCNPNYDPLNGIVVAGRNSLYGDKAGPEDNKAFAPRIGIVWDPSGSGKTAVRMGYGLFYDTGLFGVVEQNIFGNPPFVNTVTIPNTSFDNPTAGTPSISSSPKRVGSRIPADYKTPYSQQWSLDIQRDMGKGFMVDIGYYGGNAHHLIGIVDINQPRPNAYLTALPQCSATLTTNCIVPGTFINSTTTPMLNAIRPYLGYVGIDAIRTWFGSNYNSLQLQVQKRLSGSSMVNVAYTWSHALTDNQTDRSSAPQNTYDIHADYGPMQQDRRHILTANYVYDLPFFANQQGLIGHVVGGWEISGIITAQTGVPSTVFSSTDADPTGQGCLGPSPCSVRPDMNGNPNDISHTLLKWFDTSVFAPVPAGQFRNGNAPRGAIYGPGLWRVDFSLFKNIKMTERLTTQFRLETFNLFNHTNYDTINTTTSNAKFGQVTGTRDPRIMQLGLKLNF